VPFLEISRDDFGPDRDRVIVAADYLGAIMLWPRDEERRQRWCAAAAAFTMANKLSGALPKVAVHGETALFLARAPRPEEFEEEAAKLRDHGTFVGSVICELVGRSDRGRARTEITHATAHVAKVFSATGKKVSVSTINHAMPRFRPVAHLWASYVHQTTEGQSAFPCAVDQIENFLTLAEWYRERCQRFHLRRKSESLLPPNEELWRVRPEVLAVRGLGAIES
jgi:hypothetical protein